MSFQNCKVISRGVNPAGYHSQAAKRGSREFIMSPSSLREFSRCPRRWMDGYNPPDSDAKDFGSLLDCRLLTPGEFTERYSIKPATYPDVKTKESKPWNGNATFCREWAEAQGNKEIISARDVESCDSAEARLMADDVIKPWFAACDMQVLVQGDWADKKTGMTIPVRCLMDFVPRLDTEFAKCLGDFKTTRNAGRRAWRRWCIQAGYHIQGAFDMDIYCAATGEDRCNWCFIVQENFAPWQPAKRMLGYERGIEPGRRAYRSMLALYAICIKTGTWPDYDMHDESLAGGWTLVEMEPWEESEIMFEPQSSVTVDEPEEQNDDIIP